MIKIKLLISDFSFDQKDYKGGSKNGFYNKANNNNSKFVKPCWKIIKGY